MMFALLCLSVIVTTLALPQPGEPYPRAAYGGYSGSVLDDVKAYSVVKPQRVDLATMSVPGDQEHAPGSKAFELRAFGKHFRVLLQPNDFFAEGYKEIIMDPHGNIVEQKSGDDVKKGCYYRGYVEGDEQSTVALSTCGSKGPVDGTVDANANGDVNAAGDAADAGYGLSSINAGAFRSQAMPSEGRTDAVPLALDGYISAFGVQFYIEPASQHGARLQSAEEGDHVVFQPSDLNEQEPGTCGSDSIGDEEEQDADSTSATPASSPSSAESSSSSPASSSSSSQLYDDQESTSAGRRLLSGNTQKYVEVVVCNDYQRYLQRGANTVSLTNSIMNYVTSLYKSTSALTWRYRIEIRVIAVITFAYGNPYAAPGFDATGTDVVTLTLLNNWRKWTFTGGKLPSFDAAILLSGTEFAGSTIGLAYVNSMCAKSASSQSAAIIQANMRNNIPAITGGTVAHEIGHLFGMQHDNVASLVVPIPSLAYQTSACNTGTRFVLSSVVSGSVAPTQFSPCSKLHIDYFLTNGGSNQYGTSARPSCLENVPTATWNPSTAVCGDGIVQGSEQCDCGITPCVNPCCDPSTCRFKTTSACGGTTPTPVRSSSSSSTGVRKSSSTASGVTRSSTGGSQATGATGPRSSTGTQGGTTGATGGGTTGGATGGTTGGSGATIISGITMTLSWSTIYTIAWKQATAGAVSIQLLDSSNSMKATMTSSVNGVVGMNKFLWTVPSTVRLPSGSYKTRITPKASGSQSTDSGIIQLIACTFNPCRTAGSTCSNPTGKCTCPAGVAAAKCNPPLQDPQIPAPLELDSTGEVGLPPSDTGMEGSSGAPDLSSSPASYAPIMITYITTMAIMIICKVMTGGL